MQQSRLGHLQVPVAKGKFSGSQENSLLEVPTKPNTPVRRSQALRQPNLLDTRLAKLLHSLASSGMSNSQL